jgi:cytochrome P450
MSEPAPMAWPAALEGRAAKLEPFGWYRRVLGDGVRYDEARRCWDVFSYDAVTTVLTDEEAFSSETAPDGGGGGLPSMLNADPPTHTRLRDPVEEYFRPGSVRRLEPEIGETTRSLLDDAEADGDADRLEVVSDLASPLRIHTIAALLGVPAADREQFKAWSDAVVAGPQLTDGDLGELEGRRREAALALADYFTEVCARRREDPVNDLVSKVLVETDLCDMEVLGLFRLLLIAGNVTTTNLITNALWCLAEADLLDDVRGDPDRLEGAIEEALRYRSPVQRTVRRATRETELAGRRIEPDDRLAVWLGAANRDPERFDDPGRFDPGRSPNPHVAFGRGIHVCLGAPLARLEARVALETLLERYDSIERIDGGETADPADGHAEEPTGSDAEPVPSPFIYGVTAFPRGRALDVRWV